MRSSSVYYVELCSSCVDAKSLRGMAARSEIKRAVTIVPAGRTPFFCKTDTDQSKI